MKKFARYHLGVVAGAVLAASLFVSGQALPGAQPEEVGVSAERLARLDLVVREALENREAHGAVVLVGRQGKIIYRKVFGHRALVPQAEAMTLDTIFDMASLTKVMATATSILILTEQGRLSLGDRVSKYIPDFKDEGKEQITLHQLLVHYSGLRPDVDLEPVWKGYQTAIDLAKREKLRSKPGTEFVYSDINYFLLGEVVRLVTGQTVDQFSLENIYVPLGMRDTGFNPSPELQPRIAPTEMRDGAMIRGAVHDPTSFRMGGFAGHAGLFSTADDVAMFAQMILNDGVLGNVRILSPYGVLAMTTPQSPPGEDNWRGFGWDIRTRFSGNRGELFPVGSFGHTGFTGTSLWIDPHSKTFVVLLTSRLHPDGKGDVAQLRRRVANVVAASLIDLPGGEWRLR